MPANTTHPDYDAHLSYWQRMRAANAGEDAIKQRGTADLPVPSGMSGDKARPEQSLAYRNYISRARYPDAVAPAIEGMSGLMSRKPPNIKMPSALEYLHEQATADGLPLDALIDRLRQEVSTVGRYILLVDVDEEGNPYIATYSAESAINWRGDGERLTLLVLEEDVESESNDLFSHETVKQWRVCQVEDGKYFVELYRKTEQDKEPIPVDTIEPRRKGQPLNFVPAVIVGSRDLLPKPDSMPLLPVANKSLHYYRREADHAMQLYMCAHGTTPYFFGASEDEVPSAWGPSMLLTAEASDAKAGYIEITGAGLEQSASNLDEIRQEIVQATVQAMSESKRDAEAAETLRLRFQSQTATLSSIAMTTARGLERALRYCAYWAGAASEPNEDSVTVEQSTAFITETPSPQMMSALYDGIERGFIPQEILARYTRRTELHEYEDDEFLQRTAAGVAEPPEDE